MQTQDKTNLLNIAVMLTMVFCLVFATSLKAAIDSIDMAKKTTSQQLLEEEPSEKEVKVAKEVYHKNNSLLDLTGENYNNPSLKSVYLSLLKITSPYLKVHTPPPDFFIVFS